MQVEFPKDNDPTTRAQRWMASAQRTTESKILAEAPPFEVDMEKDVIYGNKHSLTIGIVVVLVLALVGILLYLAFRSQ